MQSEITFSKLSHLDPDKKMNYLKQVEAIFFEASSLKEFSSPERKLAFYKRWCKDYQDHYAHEFFIMHENDLVLGYLSGCSNSHQAKSFLEVPGFLAFEDLFTKFPAHLHINFHHSVRGRGLGSVLVKYYVDYLETINSEGVHLITSVDAKNISFYERLGFTTTETRTFNNMQLYFMGKGLLGG